MAATAVYTRVARVPRPGSVEDYHVDSNISATPTAFRLLGGRYGVEVVGATFGTVTFSKVGPDGSTVLPVLAAFAASGVALVELTPGYYTFTIA